MSPQTRFHKQTNVAIGEYMISEPVKPLSIGTVTDTVPILKTSGILAGFSFAESTGSASASFKLYDGLDRSGQLIAVINLNDSESVRDWFGVFGVYFQTGLTIDVISGSVEGAVYVTL